MVLLYYNIWKTWGNPKWLKCYIREKNKPRNLRRTENQVLDHHTLIYQTCVECLKFWHELSFLKMKMKFIKELKISLFYFVDMFIQLGTLEWWCLGFHVPIWCTWKYQEPNTVSLYRTIGLLSDSISCNKESGQLRPLPQWAIERRPISSRWCRLFVYEQYWAGISQ